MVPALARSPLAILATAVYAGTVFATVAHHEPWADEAQAWLLARDSPFFTVQAHLLHYEGTPGLWHALLFLLNRAHLPYASLNFLSAGLGVLAAFLVFRFSPFVAPVRLLLPFTYFLLYQYSVVARSYALIPPLLFGLAALYPFRFRRPLLYVGLLSALAFCSLHGLILATFAGLTTFRHWMIGLYIMAASTAVWSAWPAQDVTFVQHMNYSGAHFFETAGRHLGEGFTGNWISAVLVIAASMPFLLRARTAAAFFVLATATLIALTAVVYSQVWHFGLLFLAWIFALWIAALQLRPGLLPTIALCATLAIQCFWAVSSVGLEWRTAYSGAAAAARYLQEHGTPEAGLYGMGYATVALQPYFQHNAFSNFDHAYWDWSSRNQMIANYERLGASGAPWVVIGYKTDAENYLWNSQARRSGYRKIKHFEGNLIWKGAEWEPESFDLYQRK